MSLLRERVRGLRSFRGCEAKPFSALGPRAPKAEAYDTSSVVLNFSHVEYMNSTGIALILGLLAQARKSHRRLLIYGLSEHYLEIFKITRLADFMDVLADESSALASVRAVSSV